MELLPIPCAARERARGKEKFSSTYKLMSLPGSDIFMHSVQDRVTILPKPKMVRKCNTTTFLEGTEPAVTMTSTNNYHREQLLICFSFLILIVCFIENIEGTLKIGKTETILLSSFFPLHHCCFDYRARDADIDKENPCFVKHRLCFHILLGRCCDTKYMT